MDNKLPNRIAVLVDDPNSWFTPYAKALCDKLIQAGKAATLYHQHTDVPSVDVCFLLSCTKIVKKDFLDNNKHNIVVHASDLPKGKGFTPLKWQILENKNIIPLTLFEAVEACDAGPFYVKDTISFEGHEMLLEMQETMALKIIEMCLSFVLNYSEMVPHVQEGDSTYYHRFRKEDDCLDINKTIAEHFNHFRIADSERFPLYFEHLGHKYNIVVTKAD